MSSQAVRDPDKEEVTEKAERESSLMMPANQVGEHEGHICLLSTLIILSQWLNKNLKNTICKLTFTCVILHWTLCAIDVCVCVCVCVRKCPCVC